MAAILGRRDEKGRWRGSYGRPASAIEAVGFRVGERFSWIDELHASAGRVEVSDKRSAAEPFRLFLPAGIVDDGARRERARRPQRAFVGRPRLQFRGGENMRLPHVQGALAHAPQRRLGDFSDRGGLITGHRPFVASRQLGFGQPHQVVSKIFRRRVRGRARTLLAKRREHPLVFFLGRLPSLGVGLHPGLPIRSVGLSVLSPDRRERPVEAAERAVLLLDPAVEVEKAANQTVQNFACRHDLFLAKLKPAGCCSGAGERASRSTSGGGFEQSYNAQAAVATGSLLVVAIDVVQAPNDKGQVEPILEKIGALPENLGKVEHLLADAGYFSAGNVDACARAGVEPVIAMGRQPHHPPLSVRFAPTPAAPEQPTPVQAMAHKLKTPEGRALYALRKQTPEPVFGIIKSVLGFRQFSLRGLEKVRGEWTLVTMAWNLKRMFTLSPA